MVRRHGTKRLLSARGIFQSETLSRCEWLPFEISILLCVLLVAATATTDGGDYYTNFSTGGISIQTALPFISTTTLVELSVGV